MELLSAYRALARPPIEDGPDTFNVVTINGTPHWFGKDPSGAPVLLIGILDANRASSGPVVLQHITVQHNVRCRIVSETGTARDEVVSAVRCSSGEPALREYFVRVAEITIRHLQNSPTRADVNNSIKKLTELFRVFEQPARRTAQGLWAELLVIVLAEAPGATIAAWHTDANEAFDFSSGASRLEVKSFSGEARVHSFSMRQARPGRDVDVVVASVRAERSSGGVSIRDLIIEIARRGLTLEAMEKMEFTVAQSLGESAGAGLSITFDLERARNSLMFFDSASIPALDPPLPSGVLSVRFESLLTEHTALSLPELRERGEFFRGISPSG